jgi:GDP-mannose 6-dehydrogenase
MRISVFGLGYVGTVTAGCLARRGHTVIGVDVQAQKVAAFGRGIAPIVEPGIQDLLQCAKARQLLCATENADDAINATEVSVVCVGTPSKVTGALDLSAVRHVTSQIAAALHQKQAPHVLVFRSTMLPGSTAALVRECLLEAYESGTVSVFYFPEFLREGSAVEDFDNPSLAVVGTHDAAPPPANLMATLFGPTAGVVSWSTAEMVKYACNAFHALKIAFANEIGRVGKQIGIDALATMDLLCRDTKLNLSPYYLRPGNPFGGSCLPKDVRALSTLARQQGVHLPLLENLLPSNERHLQSVLAVVTDSGQTEVVILGLAFKPHTDDLRESAMVETAQILLGRGYTLRIYDPTLNLSALVGANRRVIDTKMPHLSALLKSDLPSALGERGLVIAAQRCAPLEELRKCISREHQILDVNGWPELRELTDRYEGLCW